MILKSPQSPPAAACLFSFCFVCSDTEPPPHAVIATTAIRARLFLSCRTVPTPLFRCRAAVRGPSPVGCPVGCPVGGRCACRASSLVLSRGLQPRPPPPPD